MKANTKKQLRLQVIIGMIITAIIILASDVVENYGYLMKAGAIVLGAAAFGLFKNWQKRDMLPRLEDI